MNFFMEVAKLRAARLLWAKLVGSSSPRTRKSLSLRTHCQTSGWSLTAQDVFNNVVRTCVEAMAATQGHTQSLHTNALDEALALPTDFSARIARNTQLFLQQESGTTRVIDPWGGSYYVERLTDDLAAAGVGAHRGGRGGRRDDRRRSRPGIPKLRIEEAAARTQARIDSGRQPVIGVNLFRPDADEHDRGAQGRQHRGARRAARQAARGCAPSATRRACDAALDALTGAAALAAAAAAGLRQPAQAVDRRGPRPGHRRRDQRRAGEGVRAAHRRRSVRSPGVYRNEVGERRRRRRGPAAASTAFAEAEGRRPRILVAKMGQDGHDRGQKVIATAFADLGFDVDVGPLFQTPDEVARQAVEADVHVVGVVLARRRPPHARARAARRAGRARPRRHHDRRRRRDPAAGLRRRCAPPGAAAIFPPGTVIADAALDLLDELPERLDAG